MRTWVSAALLPLGVVLVHALACGETTHIYPGRLFVDGPECLGPTASIDVVSGDTAADCSPICLSQPLSDGGRAIYVASMCAPYPYPFDAAGTDPLCDDALAALARSASCLSDGGSSAPLLVDAGTD